MNFIFGTVNSSPDRKYFNCLILAAFSKNYFYVKTSVTVKNSYLPTYPDDKAEV